MANGSTSDSRTGEGAQNRRRRPGISLLAVAATVAWILGIVAFFYDPFYWALLRLGVLRTPARVLPSCGLYVVALVLGLAAVIRARRSRGTLAGRNLAIIGLVVSTWGLGATGLLFYPAESAANQASCLSNVKQLAQAMMMYAQDYDEPLPANRWSDRLVKYVAPDSSGSSLFVCPEVPLRRCGYAFNRALAGLSAADLRKLPHPERTVVIFETDLGWNGAGGPEALVERPRHRGNDAFAFADGSGRAIARDKQSDLIWRP